MDSGTIGLIGGIGGGIIGVVGGAVGTGFSIKNTHGPRERAFVVKASVAFWLAIISFLVAVDFASMPYQALLWLLYLLALPFAIRFLNQGQDQIRRKESTTNSAPQ